MTTFNHFLRANEWQSIKVPEVKELLENGENLTFFSHIQNPHTRHTKGIVQLLHKYNVAKRRNQGLHEEVEWGAHQVNDLISKNEEAFSFIAHCIFDEHTVSISDLFFDNGIDINDVNWIPMDHPQYSSEELTDRFLMENGFRFRCREEDGYIRRNISSDMARINHQYISDLKQVGAVQEGSPINAGEYYRLYFTPAILRKDLDLYRSVMEKYGVNVDDLEG